MANEPIVLPVEGSSGSEDDIVTLLSGDDKVDDKAPKEDKKDTDDKDDKVDDKTDDDELELKDDKKDDKTEDKEEEKLDLKDDNVDITAPPRKREVEKEFPGFFKKFPWMEKMMFRDREITEKFGSFDNLTEFQEKATALDELESSFSQGSTVEIFSKMKENDPEAFGKVARNLLPHLQQVDKDAYFAITTDLIARTLDHIYSDGDANKNEELKEAAKLLFGYVFPRGYNAPKQEETPKDDKLEQERAEFNQERLNTAVGDVRTRIGNVLKNTVNSYIDPKGEMSEYVKRNAVRDVLSKVDDQLANDLPFRRSVNALWDEARKAKYSKASTDKIKSAYLGKSKGLLRAAIIEARKEALKDSSSSRKKSDENEDTSPSRRTIITPGRSTTRSSGKPQMKPGESIMDFLSRD